ncbi:MAG: hypothetical protein JOY82_08660 [Streptosporangiaceae bacterium]|nr:hypothetical protein [Streptosporangiaceae bacterium]MBV9854585.1 hypothetical protein [Streptosporangiaceae bacterium]
MTQQESYPARRPGRRLFPDDDVPPWATTEGAGPPSGEETGFGGPPRRSRGDRLADRRRRRRLIAAGCAVLAVIAVVTVVLSQRGSSKPGEVVPGSLITTFLPGEIQKVPNACTVVPAASLQQILPGQAKQAAPPLDGGQDSQCSWTLDRRPVYRLLEVDIDAYSPSGLASGDGSATFAAIDAFSEAMQVKQNPGPRSGEPPAQVTSLPGLGSAAFSSVQVFRSSTVTDVATVVVRYRNVLVSVVVNGIDHSRDGHYGPVSASELGAAAQTVAQQVTAALTR